MQLYYNYFFQFQIRVAIVNNQTNQRINSKCFRKEKINNFWCLTPICEYIV